MAGTEDKLMGSKLMEETATEYRNEVQQLSQGKLIDPLDKLRRLSLISKNAKQAVEGGVIMMVVERAKHHIQNDVQAGEAAEAPKLFLDQL